MKFKKLLAYFLTAVMVAPMGQWAMPVKVQAEEAEVTDELLEDNDTQAPEKWGATPSTYQFQYQKEELAAFVHFGMNTFTGSEWGNGTESPNSFNLTQNFDAETIVKSFKEAGFKKVIVTAKHHDGFCIWRSEYTEHDVESSPYKGDVLEELSAACTKYNLDMGLYLSPWDVNNESYGYRDENGNATTEDKDVLDYNEYYNNQLTEILGNDKYGNNGVFKEVWMDGAKGDGSFAQEYDFQKWFATIQKYEGKAAGREDDCMLFGAEAYTTVRWIGNENGFSANEMWAKSTTNKEANTIDSGERKDGVFPGIPTGNQWTIPEADGRITSGWFWGAGKATPKSIEALAEMYFSSVGQNATFLLNIPPNTSGTIDAPILARVKELGENIKETFAYNMATAENVSVAASSVRGNSKSFSPNNVIDGDDETYWTTDDATTTGSLTIDLGTTKTFDVVSIEEAIQLGQRISSFKVEYQNAGGEWKLFTEGKTIGSKRLSRKNPVKADKLRISILSAYDVPLISEVGIYKASEGFELGSGIPEGIEVVDNADSDISDGNGFTYSGWNAESGPQFINGTGVWANAGVEATITFTGEKAWVVGTKDPGHGTADIYIDGEKVDTMDTNASSRALQQILYETPDLEYGKHTMRIVNKTKAIGLDAAYVLSNEGKGYFEIENAKYRVDEDSTLDITVKRKGGTKGAASVLLQDNPGTAVQGHYETTEGIKLDFAEGETEKVVTIRTKRFEQVTGDLYFTLELVSPEGGPILGFIPTARITITDADEAKESIFIPANGSSVLVEAEDFELVPIEGDKYVRIEAFDWASNGKAINWFEPGNVIKMYYDAAKAGTYAVKASYRSGRYAESNPNRICWSGENITTGQVDVLGEDGATVTHEVTFDIEIKKAGTGYFILTADEKAAPMLDKFEFTYKVDQKAALQAQIDAVSDLVEEDYSIGSWATFAERLATAVEKVAKEDASDEELIEAKTTLLGAYNALVSVKIYKAFLESAIKEEMEYTPTSYAAYKIAYEGLNEKIKTADVTKEELDAAKAALEEAIGKLVTIGDQYLSDIPWESATVGYGDGVKKDKNYAGGTITLLVNGANKEFTKGLGTHADSTIIYDITEREAKTFKVYVGVDAGQGTKGSVTFKIYGDDNLLYTSAELTGGSEAEYINVDVSNVTKLKLVADKGVNNGNDHAMWADAKLGKAEIPDVPVESVTLSKDKVGLKAGATETITATVNPSNATNKNVAWSTDKATVATVVGGKITAVAEGTAKITATAGGKTATCTVTVTKVEIPDVPVESVTLDKTEVALEVGATETVKATVNPENATDSKVTWTTDKASVATVAGGKITAVAVGTAKITATVGGKTATCTVTVTKTDEPDVPVKSVTLDKTAIALKVGATETVKATVNPTNATDKKVTWSTDKATVATVADGIITAVAEGTAKITAIAGGKTATCTVTVTKVEQHPTNGWYQDKTNNKWKYYKNNIALKSNWVQDHRVWYYIGRDEYMTTKWQVVDGKWYYLGTNGKMVTKWKQIDKVWYYFNKSGAMVTKWQKIDNTWYYFNKSGKMQTNWFKEGNTWYYLKANGAMATGWNKVGRTWYYMNASGKMQTGWVKVKGLWYYLKANGAMATGWVKVKGVSYYLNTKTGAWNGQTR